MLVGKTEKEENDFGELVGWDLRNSEKIMLSGEEGREGEEKGKWTVEAIGGRDGRPEDGTIVMVMVEEEGIMREEGGGGRRRREVIIAQVEEEGDGIPTE